MQTPLRCYDAGDRTFYDAINYVKAPNLRQFANQNNEARKEYRRFVADGLARTEESPWGKPVGQIVFGGKEFVADTQDRLSEAKEIGEIPRVQRFPGRPPLESIFSQKAPQNKGVHNKQIADQLNIHYTTVSEVLKNFKTDFSRPDPIII